MVKERGCYKCTKIRLNNVFGKIKTVDEETIATINKNGIKFTTKFGITEIEEKDGVIIGKNTIAVLEEKTRKLGILKKNFK